MAFINSLAAISPVAPSGVWTWFILDVFSFIGAYGLVVIVFTLILKAVLSPLDIYQRYAMKKNQRITERIKPELDKLKKQYANEPAILQRKTQAINKREGYSTLAGCLPMIVTLVISIWLLTELTGISQFKQAENYSRMYGDYVTAEQSVYADEKTDSGENVFYWETDENGGMIGDTLRLNYEVFGFTRATEQDPWTGGDWEALNKAEAEAQGRAQTAGQKAVLASFDKNNERFLWVNNIWIADVPWTSSVQDAAAFKSAIADYGTSPGKFFGKDDADVTAKEKAEWTRMIARYDEVTASLQGDETRNGMNGYLVLPILCIAVMLGSQMLTRSIQKKSGLAGGGANPLGGGKLMTFIMPIMFGIFSLFYTAAFALYMIVNSAFMIVITLLASGIMALTDRKEVKKAETEEGVKRIGRPDPNDKK